MALSTSARNEKQRCGMKYHSLSRCVAAKYWFKSYGKWKEPNEEHKKTYMDVQTVLYTLMNWSNEWLFVQVASLHKCVSSAS